MPDVLAMMRISLAHTACVKKAKEGNFIFPFLPARGSVGIPHLLFLIPRGARLLIFLPHETVEGLRKTPRKISNQGRVSFVGREINNANEEFFFSFNFLLGFFFISYPHIVLVYKLYRLSQISLWISQMILFTLHKQCI